MVDDDAANSRAQRQPELKNGCIDAERHLRRVRGQRDQVILLGRDGHLHGSYPEHDGDD
ncbi:hypothetical protein P4U99_11945 [Brevibacillus agri]|uniref:hypothetical protein n=1 Tax=Brevibacillus agri TaxID=51101 RepID=UPI002E21BEC4|nr:hypothetical protein [Brevibacillus agri]MED1654575.1 hypothetical protein [Brevibacillus agri]MED1686124.1 hypothetical protein [Brevibacillus agri]MED1690552.1 hypothetical protein [Brevibacillus agri]MED1695709.1 hypothetical protein [Brevibacillus agri]